MIVQDEILHTVDRIRQRLDDMDRRKPTHRWWFRKWLPDRKGELCRVIARGRGRGPRNVLVEFEDGFRVVSTRFCVRRSGDD